MKKEPLEVKKEPLEVKKEPLEVEKEPLESVKEVDKSLGEKCAPASSSSRQAPKAAQPKRKRGTRGGRNLWYYNAAYALKSAFPGYGFGQ